MKTKKTEQKQSACILPHPDELFSKENMVRVTLLLNKSTVDFFKKEAIRRKICYQAMIRILLDEYVKHYSN